MPVDITDKYIRIRILDPDLFIEGSFKTIDISVEKGIKAIIGKLKEEPEGNTVVQSYLFDKEKWTEKEAIRWVEEHKKYNLISLINLFKEIPLGDKGKKICKHYRAKTLDIDEDEKTIWAIATDDSVDRDGEVNTIDSWQKRIDTFLKHPILVSSHNYESLLSQIGEVVDIKFEKEGMVVKLKYYAGYGNDESDWAWFLAKNGMAMFSIGYIPHKVLTDSEIPEQYKNMGAKKVYVDNEILEISQVVIGANRGALQLGVENPSIEHCQYMYDVVKSFGNKIPELDKKVVITDKSDKIKKDSFIFSPIEINNIKELDEIVSIWKSGKVISQKNQLVLLDCKKKLEEVIVMIDRLLTLTEKPDINNEGGDEEKSFENYTVRKLIDEIKNLEKKIF